MKNATLTVVAAFAALLLSGCDKDIFSSRSEIRFTAESGAETKVEYSGVTDNNNIERIDWVQGDKVMIWSDKARTWQRNGSGRASAVYNVVNITPAGRYSRAGIEVPYSVDEGGLQWDENGGSHLFLGLYPAVVGAENEATSLTSQTFGSLPVTFTTAQRHLQNGIVDASKLATYGYHFAKKEASKPSGDNKVTLSFEPYFTTFEFHIVDAEKAGLRLHEFVLESDKDLAGRDIFTINADKSITQLHGPVPSSGNTDKNIWVKYNANSTFGLTSPVSLAQDGETAHVITVLGGMNDDTDHKMKVKLTFLDNGGQPTDIRTLDLKARTSQNGSLEWIPFPRGKKAIIHLHVLSTGISFNITVVGQQIQYFTGSNLDQTGWYQQ